MRFQKHNRSSVLRLVLVVSVAMLAVAPVLAQSVSTYSEYSAKFLCGIADGTSLEHAQYSTSINIHNPNLFSSDTALSFLKKAVIANPEGKTLIPPSAFRQDSLPNDYAESVNCAVIRSLLGAAAPAAPAFIEGFVVLVVPPASNPNQLDVTAVYTSSKAPSSITLDVVPITGRIITPPAAGVAITGQVE
jgi:hypothetical protein